MKYIDRKGWVRGLAILVLSCILLQNTGTAFAKSPNAKSIKSSALGAKRAKKLKGNASQSSGKQQVIIGEGDSAQEYETLSAKVQYTGVSFDCTIPVVQWNGIWMAPVKNIFSDILGCYYQTSKEDKNILVTTPDRENTIKFTQNTNVVVINGNEETAPAETVLGTKKDADYSDYMVPLEFTLEALGYICSIKEGQGEDSSAVYNLVEITSDYLYHIITDNFSYDKEKYSNMLIGVVLLENDTEKLNEIKGLTLEAASKKNVKIINNAAEYSVTLQFLNTYNPFGNITQSVKNGITNSIKIWETEDRTTCVQINYNKKQEYESDITEDGCTITILKGSFSMKVILPEDVPFSKIETTDQYWNQKFLIILPGDYISFYKKYVPVDNSSYITGIRVSLTDEEDTKITVNTKGLKGYRLDKGDGCFNVQVGDPKDIYENIVLIDAGHGGKDNGASKSGLKEKKLNLTIAYKQIKEYFEKVNSPVKAYWTRHDDTFVNLYARPTYSAKYQADLFVSLHMNSANSSSANGTEVYYSKANNSSSFSGITSKLFAKKMQSTLVNALGTKNRGVKQAGFVVIKNNSVPSILIELGFITGSSDKKNLKKESFQKKAAKTIYQGICNTFKSYPTER